MNLSERSRFEQLLSDLESRHSPRWIDDGDAAIGSAEFVSRVRQRAGELAETGTVSGARRAVEASGSVAFFIEMCATWLAGGVFCPVEPGLSDVARRDIGRLLQSNHTPAAPASASESTVLLTSGSTGIRKGVRLTLAALLDNAQASTRRLGMSDADLLMINIPFHFTSAICHFLACFVSGARMHAVARPLLARDLVERVRVVKPTGFGGAPLQARWLADGLGENAGLSWLMTSGDDLPASTRHAVSSRLPDVRLHVFYGLTEVAGRLTSLHPDDRARQEGSVGLAIDGLSVEVLDENGHVCPAGELGEVHASGRTLMLGYIGLDGSHAAPAGSFATGDMGWKDDRGFLYLAGRRDDVFKVSGEKVSGLAVRDALLKTALVADAFVVPVRQRNGLVVAGALVSPPDGASIDLVRLRAAARAGFGTHQLPREYFVVGAIPRTGSGKPDRRAIDGLLGSMGWRREHGGGVYVLARETAPEDG